MPGLGQMSNKKMSKVVNELFKRAKLNKNKKLELKDS